MMFTHVDDVMLMVEEEELVAPVRGVEWEEDNFEHVVYEYTVTPEEVTIKLGRMGVVAQRR